MTKKTLRLIEGKPRAVKTPEELWMLWYPEGSCWVCSVDDAPRGPTYLVAFTQEEAENAAIHQRNSYDVECIPYRVK